MRDQRVDLNLNGVQNNYVYYGEFVRNKREGVGYIEGQFKPYNGGSVEIGQVFAWDGCECVVTGVGFITNMMVI